MRAIPRRGTGFSLSVDRPADRRGGEHVCGPHLHHEVRDGGCGGHLSKENPTLAGSSSWFMIDGAPYHARPA